MLKLRRKLFLWSCINLVILVCIRNLRMSYKNSKLTTWIERKISDANNLLHYNISHMDVPWWEMQSCDLDQIINSNEAKLLSKFTKVDDELGYNTPYADYVKWKNENAVNHTCGWKSWNAGYGQKVIAFCLYGNKSEYWNNIDALLSRAVELYPGWYIRIYTITARMKSSLCPLINTYPNLHICDITSLPPPLRNISRVHPAMWRFAALSDRLVDTVIFRDSDAMMLQREVDAVKEWLKSNKALHLMRDHPSEHHVINAGMWGAHLKHNLRNSFSTILFKMFAHRENQINRYGTDQYLPEIYLWPVMKQDVLAHDSYNCEKYPGSVPFPTQRVDQAFIGNKDLKRNRTHTIRVTCPLKCRPKNHQDWEYC